MTSPTASSVQPGGRVLELTGPRAIEIAERPIPEPAPGQIVVSVSALGLCGTDLHLYAGRGETYPWIVGHDAAGTVHAVGREVVGLTVGQRVAVDPVLRCGECEACRTGAVQLCKLGGYLGMLGPGMAAQYVALPAAQVVPLPDTVSDRAATALEPVAVALHTLRRVGPLLPSPGSAIIVGGGPLGLLQAKVMNHFGWLCTVLEPQERRRAVGADLGLITIDPFDTDRIREIAPARLIVETSATAAGVDLAEQLVAPGAVVAVIGRAPHSIPPPSVLLKELSILGVKGGPGQYEATVELVASGVVDPEAVITHTFGWDEADAAFAETSGQPETIVRSALEGPWS